MIPLTATNYTYEQCLVDDILDSTDLLNEHRQAVKQYERGEFSPDRLSFNAMQEAGILVSFVVKHEDDILCISGEEFDVVESERGPTRCYTYRHS